MACIFSPVTFNTLNSLHLVSHASQHINISGLYEFIETIKDINVDHVVKVLSKILDEVVNPSAIAAKKKVF